MTIKPHIVLIQMWIIIIQCLCLVSLKSFGRIYTLKGIIRATVFIHLFGTFLFLKKIYDEIALQIQQLLHSIMIFIFLRKKC